MTDIMVEDVEPKNVIALRREGSFEEIGKMISELCTFAGRKGIQLAGPPIYICHETGSEEAKAADSTGTADLEVAVPVVGDAEESGEVEAYELQGGKMAKIVHKGPFDGVGSTYQRLFKWMAENGKQVTGPTREVYLSDPTEVQPEELMTEIYAPID